MRNREGFTLIELMVVTLIIGLLAAIAQSAYSGLRERSMTSAAQVELRNVMTAAERYRAVTGQYPAAMTDLVSGGFHTQSTNIGFCQFQLQPGPPQDLLLEAAHLGSTIHLVAQYPSQGVTAQELVVGSDCGAP
jgi:prepilin-type N-terminal cleavage/methylation domain-containing protein